jgi:CRISPR-associated protein Cas1
MTEVCKPEDEGVPGLIPARMLNEFAYCPRLCYIEWVQGEFVDSADTVDGRYQHRRVDSGVGKLAEEEYEPIHARSVHLTGLKAGITCKVDLLEGEGKQVTPVDYKRGKAPDIPEGAYEPDRVQLCAQGLVLRENGFACDEGMAYFVRSKKKVPVRFDESLIQRTKELHSNLRNMAESGEMPPPLDYSPKCFRCSLAGICLPDEVNLLREMEAEKQEVEEEMDDLNAERQAGAKEKIRRLLPARDDQIPVYVVGQGNTVRKKGERLEIWSREGKVSEARIMETSQLSLYGGVEITTPAMVELMQRGVPVIHYTYGGWFQGICLGMTHKNVELRMRQFQCVTSPNKALAIARGMISGKIKNCRTLLRRNDPGTPKELLALMAKLAKDSENAYCSESLLGIEGAAAEAYFSRFSNLLKGGADGFSFENRNKRPPKDPVNAVLSYLYGILVKDLFVTLLAVGFDPYLGVYHRPRYGRPALALDMMEEFRPLVADSTAVTLFNNRVLSKKDFIRTGFGISMTPEGKKKVIEGYERRMETDIIHPLFRYSVSYRRLLEVQARLLARVISGEIREYPAFCTR